jgi:hypothetical protein
MTVIPNGQWRTKDGYIISIFDIRPDIKYPSVHLANTARQRIWGNKWMELCLHSNDEPFSVYSASLTDGQSIYTGLN